MKHACLSLLFGALSGLTLSGFALPAHAASGTPDRSDTLRRERNYPIREVIVTGNRETADPRLPPVAVSVISREQIAQSHRPSLLPTLTERVPGLFVTGRGVMGYGVSTGAAGGMTMRGIGGSPTTGMLLLVDGQPQYMGLMGHPVADVCRSASAERVEVVRGPASAIYGSNAMGGAINIITRRMTEPGVRTDLQAGYGSYNTLQSSLTNRIRAGRFTSTITASYDRSDGHRKDMGFDQYGGGVKLGCDLTAHWEMTLQGDITHFDAQNPGTVSAPILDNRSHITRGAASMTVTNRYERSGGSWSLFYNRGRHRIYDGYSPGQTPPDYQFNSRDELAGISLFQHFTLLHDARITLGVDYRRFGGKAWNRFPNGDPDRVTARRTMHETAAYAALRLPLLRRLTLDAGVRIDHHSHAGTEWVPQAALSWRLPREALLTLSASKGFRFPTIRELFMFPSQNPDLRPERLWSYELAFSQTLAEGRFRYGANLFRIDGDNLIQTQPVDGRPQNVNTGRVENTGVEVQLAGRPSPMWSVEANYSYLHMAYPVVAAPRHKLFVGADFARGKWSLSTGVQYVHGLCTSLRPTVEESDFLLWNLSVRRRITRRGHLFVRGENLLAQRYEINAGYPMPKATCLAGMEWNL